MPPLVVVLGTTASGKSDLAIQLAQRLGRAEIVSADSRQVYRGLDIGSGKVTPREQALVPHHLLDMADVRGPRFTVAEYQRLAFTAIRAIHARGAVPILAGGTGLYISAVVDNPSFPPVAPDERLRAELEQRPLPDLVAQLWRLDPEGAAAMDLANPRRVVRALEVTLASGVPASRQRQQGLPRVRALQLGVTWPAPELRRRIAARVDQRLAQTPSMLDEVRGLLAAGVPPERLLELGLEYRFLTRHLRGELEYRAMVDGLKTAIAQFARRQQTWFRRDPRIQWLDPGGDLPAQAETQVRRFRSQADATGPASGATGPAGRAG